MSRAPRHVFFSPHPDDIAFSAFASLVRVPAGVPRALVTVFSQSCWSFCSPVEPGQALAVSARRLEEDMRFARAQGVALVHLGLRDTSLRGLPAGGEYRRSAEEDPLYPALVAELRQVLEGEGPEAVCHVPLGLGGHVDHLLVRDAVLALRGGARGVSFYEDLPYAEGYGEEEIAGHARSLRVGAPLEPCVLELDWPGKLEALRMYESQLEASTLPRIERHARRVAASRSLAERVWRVAAHE
jgi:deacetylase